MADTYTTHLTLRRKAIHTAFTMREVSPNGWAQNINHDLDMIDMAIGDVCSPEQIAAIRERLQGNLKFFWSPADV